MVLLAGLCVLLVTVCNMASALTHLEEQPLWYDRRSDVTDFSDTGRIKRGMPTMIGALVGKLKPYMTSKNYRLYKKKGGYEQALRDYASLEAYTVKDLGKTKLGHVGDTNIHLSEDYVKGSGVLDIWKTDSKTGRVIIDRIKYD